jgi:hypothetical protein
MFLNVPSLHHRHMPVIDASRVLNQESVGDDLLANEFSLSRPRPEKLRSRRMMQFCQAGVDPGGGSFKTKTAIMKRAGELV